MAKKDTKQRKDKKKHKRMLVLYHGGTVGMESSPSGLIPPEDTESFEAACLETFELWEHAESYEIVFEFISKKDSTNVVPDDWTRLIYRVAEAQEEGYAGVLVLHGTDTLAYTSTGLSFGLHGEESGLAIPVVLTGAQTPISIAWGDGRTNLLRALLTLHEAISEGVAEVLITFADRVLLASRCDKQSERRFTAFDSSVMAGQVGIIDSSGVTLNPHLRRASPKSKKLDIRPHFSKGVLVLDIGPGLEPEMILDTVKGGKVRAIVLKSPGEGNVPNEGPGNFIPLIKKLTSKFKIPVVIASRFVGGSTGGAHYAVGSAPLKAGAVAAYDTTHVAVEVKVRWLLSLGITSTTKMRKALAHSYCGEVTPPSKVKK